MHSEYGRERRAFFAGRKVDGTRTAARVGRRYSGGWMGRKGKAAQAGWKRPVAGILLGGFAVVALLGLSSYRPRGGDDWAGPVGHRLAGALLEVAGMGGYAAALFLLAVACALVAGRPRLSFARAGSVLLCALAAAALVVATDLWALRAAAGAAKLSVAGGALALRGAAAAISQVREMEEERASRKAETLLIEADEDARVPVAKKAEALALKCAPEGG